MESNTHQSSNLNSLRSGFAGIVSAGLSLVQRPTSKKYWQSLLLVATVVTSSNLVVLTATPKIAAAAVTCNFYVAVNGTSSGNGSSASPWDLQTALNQPSSVQAGSTICLRSGTYYGVYTSKLAGAVGNPITVRSAPGEWAVIDYNQNATLTTAITSSSTKATLNAGAKMPNSSVVIRVGGEDIQLVNRVGDTYTINARAWSGTTAVDHPSGSVVAPVENIITVNGSDVTFRDLEVTDSRTARVLTASGSNSVDQNQRYTGFNVFAPRSKIINNFIHDTGQGIGFWSQAIDSEVYGNLSYNNGVKAPDRGHGHGIYTQNDIGTKLVSDNITFGNFGGYGLQLYGSSAATLRNYNVNGNVNFNNGWLIGGNAPADNINIDSNYLYGSGISLGYGNPNNGTAIITNNHIYADTPLAVNWWNKITATGNNFYMKPTNSGGLIVIYDPTTGDQSSKYIINNNKYIFGRTFQDADFVHSTATGPLYYKFPQWQTLGFDANSTYLGPTSSNPAATLATGTEVYYRPNQYEAGRANVIIFNFAKASTVNVDLTKTGLTAGQAFEIRNGQNFAAAPIATGTYNGQSVAVNVNNLTIAQPNGDSGITNTSVCPEFCTLVVVPTTSAPQTPPATPAPTISFFTASPATITAGNSSTLSWSVANATAVSINQGVGTVTGSSVSVAPTTTTTYTLTATGAGGTVTSTTTVTVNPVTPPVTTGSCTGTNCVNINAGQTFQTIDGWEATSQSGQDTPAWNAYKNTLLDQAAADGINRLRVEVRSGAESNVDSYTQFLNGQITESQFDATGYSPVNDDADPNHINPSGFQWSQLDREMDQIVMPLRQRLQARGEQLYINVNFVDFPRVNRSFSHNANSAEYAEFVLAAYQHLQSKYGITPDAWEVVLEADNGPWSATQVGNAIKTAGDRLTAAGITPHFIAPSVTNGLNILPASQGGGNWMTQIAAVSGAMQYIDTISYHRYTSPNQTQTQNIGALGTQYGKKTAMLEKIGADYNNLQMDLKYGNNSAWQQFTLAYPGADNGGSYYPINTSNVNNPIVNTGSRTKLLIQYFKYIRLGAVRIGASSTGNTAIDPLAFRNTDGKYVVVSPVTSTTSFGINGLPAATYGVFYTTTGGVTTNAADQTIAAGGSVQLTNIPAGVVTVYAKGAGTVTPPQNPAPTINSFTASPSTITAGGSSTLSWSVANATSVSINQGVGSVTGSSKVVSPTASTTYTLTATGAGGTTSATTTVTVSAPVPVNTKPTGSLDGVNAEAKTIFGWAQDANTANTPVTVHVYIDKNAGTAGAVPNVVVAGDTRSDVGAHAFNFAIPTLYQDGKAHQVWVWAIDTTDTSGASNVQLTGSPKTFTIGTVPAPVNLPVINSFTASPATIAKGNSTRLSWNVSNATTLFLEGVGDETGAGGETVTPLVTTTYVLTATNSSGAVTKTVTVTVNGTTSPTNVKPSGSLDGANATTKTIFGWAQDSDTLSIPTTVHLYIDKNAGTAGASPVIVVAGDNRSDVGNHAFNYSIPSNYFDGKAHTVWAWAIDSTDITGANNVQLGGSPKIFTIAAPEVVLLAPTITSFTASPSTVTAGNTTTLSWATTDATSLNVSGVGAVTGTSVDVSPTTTTTYTLTATNATGSVTKTIAVTVNPVQNEKPVINSFIASPSTIAKGGFSILSWSVTNATSISINQEIGTVIGSSKSVSPSVSTTYVLTAINANGSATATTTITVVAPEQTAYPLEGDNFICKGGSTVYYYHLGLKEAYSELAVYQAWNGTNFGSIKTFNADVCESIVTKGLARLPDGVLVTVAGNPTVYMIEGTKARPFTSFEAFIKYANGKQIYTISLSYLHTYSRGSNIEQ